MVLTLAVDDSMAAVLKKNGIVVSYGFGSVLVRHSGKIAGTRIDRTAAINDDEGLSGPGKCLVNLRCHGEHKVEKRPVGQVCQRLRLAT